MSNVKELVNKIYQKRLKIFDNVTIGSTVRINTKIKEGGKERIQGFEGVVIARRGSGLSEMITVRKISYGGIGVERTFPICSPLIESVKIIKKGKAKRAKLYFLRESIGKKAKKQARKFGSDEVIKEIEEKENKGNTVQEQIQNIENKNEVNEKK